MDENDIEREIQARVDFKMTELLTGVKNRVLHKYNRAFDMTPESEYAWKAFEELAEMVKKETVMGTPRNDMDMHERWKAKEAAVKNIMELFKCRGRDYDSKIRPLVNEIEKAQEYFKPKIDPRLYS
jgi:hypothetical protein